MGLTRPVLVAVMGPTASGKSGFAEAIAESLDAQLLNADAFQVYRGLDIGTAKPVDRSRYRLLDLVDPDEAFGVGAWVRHASAELAALWAEGRNVVVVGGTGLSIRALFEEYAGMSDAPDPQIRAELVELEARQGSAALQQLLKEEDPEAFATIDLSNPLRVRRALEKLRTTSPELVVTLPPYTKVKVAVEVSREILAERIDARVRRMLDAGWESELLGLRCRGYGENAPGMRAIGYRDVGQLVDGLLGRDEAVAAIAQSTRRYAKRQQTWLRSEPYLRPIEFDMMGAWVSRALDCIREAARS